MFSKIQRIGGGLNYCKVQNTIIHRTNLNYFRFEVSKLVLTLMLI